MKPPQNTGGIPPEYKALLGGASKVRERVLAAIEGERGDMIMFGVALAVVDVMSQDSPDFEKAFTGFTHCLNAAVETLAPEGRKAFITSLAKPDGKTTDVELPPSSSDTRNLVPPAVLKNIEDPVRRAAFERVTSLFSRIIVMERGDIVWTSLSLLIRAAAQYQESQGGTKASAHVYEFADRLKNAQRIDDAARHGKKAVC